MADWRMPGPYYAYAYSLLYPDQNYWANADGEPMVPQMVQPMLNMASYSEPPPVYPPVQVDSRSDKDSASPDSCSAGDSDILSEGQELPGSARLQAMGSPVTGEPVSSTLGDNDGNREIATPDRNNFDATANVKAKKRKLRTAFSQEQMEALRQRFQVQKYLTPVEMKTLATMIGLTYKQIKTWFQNRRMKMKRYQKENSGPEACFPVMPTTAPAKWQGLHSQGYYLRRHQGEDAEYPKQNSSTAPLPALYPPPQHTYPHHPPLPDPEYCDKVLSKELSIKSEEDWQRHPSGMAVPMRFDYCGSLSTIAQGQPQPLPSYEEQISAAGPQMVQMGSPYAGCHYALEQYMCRKNSVS
ncbi:homeobox protein NANOG [Erpetoichthys calabaricus]|uniref:homeobox protein NANOG n=1 Tax=Erpetoichthys calabaricus TaxID=27687 RepID=UPI0022348B72|nr:homeobox protein NANOG [Erpetoichthys calabaricus]